MNDASSSDLRRRTLEAIHDSAVDAIITIDQSGTIETVNPATEKLFGYSADELIGENIKKLMPSPFRDEHDQYLKNYLESGIRKIIGIGRETIARKRDGSTFPIHLAVNEVQLNDRRVFAGFVRDVSDLKLIEQQRATLGRIIEDSLNEVYIFDTQSLQFVQVNRGARENLRYSLDELRELTPVDIKPEFTRSGFEEMIRPLLTGEKEKLEFSTVHCRKDGSTYDVDVYLQVSTYLTRHVFVAIILDVTHRRKAEQLVRQQQENMQSELERLVETRTAELRKTQAELVRSEKFSTLGKVSGGIAHEIRNPLNAVKTSAYFLLNAKDPSREKIQEHLERIDRQVSLIDNVVTALSDVAKLPEAEVCPVDLESVLRSIIRSTDLPDHIQVRFEFPDNLPDALADENQIVIAFRNLIRNARNAMADGGTLTIAARLEGSHVVSSIADTGAGIAPENLDKVLEPLFTTRARGMGLGLSITRAIVEKNHGSLTVESDPGKGSVFRIRLEAVV